MTIDIPDELFKPFVQWVRDFDTLHPGCTIHIFGETKETGEALKKIFSGIKPGLPFVGELKLKDKA